MIDFIDLDHRFIESSLLCLLSKLRLPTKIWFLNMLGFEILYCCRTNNEYSVNCFFINLIFRKLILIYDFIFTFQNFRFISSVRHTHRYWFVSRHISSFAMQRMHVCNTQWESTVSIQVIEILVILWILSNSYLVLLTHFWSR